MDPRNRTLAHNLIHYSCRLKPGEKVLISCVGPYPLPLVRALVKEAYAAGATPFVNLSNSQVDRELLLGATPEQQDLLAKRDVMLMEQMDAYIGVRGDENALELSDVPAEKQELHAKHYLQPVHYELRVPKTRWVVLRYPSPAMAQAAGQSQEAFEDFYFDVCCLDYGKMDKAMDALKALMERTDRVRLVAQGTDLTFSIQGIPAVKCAGEMNIPDGEVYTAPVKDSVNGVITYNTPSSYQGTSYENVRLTFENGKIVAVDGNLPQELEAIFNTDAGARYVGEFAIGVNPYITRPMNDILFDEKIAGSIHFTPGNCYDDAYNGNQSAIHWDLVLIQTPEYGGGEIWFDNVLIRKDGRFVLPELECLNPENLK